MNLKLRKEELVDVVHKRLLALRNLQTLTEIRDFQILFDLASEEQRLKARKLIDDFDPKGLRDWYKQRRYEHLGSLSVRELRSVASQLGVSNYNRLTKPLLLSEIMRLRLNAEAASNVSSVSSLSGHEGSDDPIGCNGGSISSSSGICGPSNGVGLNGTAYMVK